MHNSKRFLALIGISLASFLTAIDFAIINTALPTIQYELKASLTELQWIMNIYVLLICATMVTMGRLGDLFGRKKILIIGIIIFLAASLFAGFSRHLSILIFFRALQGLGSAIIIPCSLALITDLFPTDERAKAIGIWSGINGIGFAIGPVLGGLLVSWLNWPWVFFIVIPFAILSLLICLFFLDDRRRIAKTVQIDKLGFCLLSVGMATLILGIIEGPNWGWDASTISCFVIAFICLISLYFAESHMQFPIIEFHLFANHQFLAGAVANFAVVAFAYAGFFLMPLYLQNIQDQEAYMIGLMLLPITVAMTIVSPITGRLVSRFSEKNTMLVGLFLLITGIGMQCFFNTDTSFLYIIIAFILFGLAWGIVWGSATNVAISALPEEASGLASGVLWTQQNIGGAVGLAIAGMIFRIVEKNSLMHQLTQNGIILTDNQRNLIRGALANPENAKELLNQFTVEHTIIYSIFTKSFINGYSAAMWFSLIVSICALIIVWLSLKQK